MPAVVTSIGKPALERSLPEMPPITEESLATSEGRDRGVTPVPQEVTLPVRQDLLWRMPATEPAFVSFREWSGRFFRGRDEGGKGSAGE